jgi:glycine dehydrogenase subunit 1
VPFSRLDPDAGLDDVLLVCATETTTAEDIDALVEGLIAELAA